MDLLEKYLPKLTVAPIHALLKEFKVQLKIVHERKTRHGDYRRDASGLHHITINSNLNKYRFLITLVHELAHLVAFQKYGRHIQPHGVEWKHTFQKMMIPFLRPDIYPSDLLPVVVKHFKNPRASSDTDALMSIALRRYDPETDKNYIFELPYGSRFVASNGKLYQLGKRLRKRYECLELDSGKMYVFQPNAQVTLMKTNE
ncbi:MAG: SprT-like domain-containing protein [Bacteroidota bacterium]|nr:SprT-like domain-containing protein [Bacteroidota bacterium]